MTTVILLSMNAFAFEKLEKGSSGDSVKAIQESLIKLGYLSGSADGKFGAMTEEAVKAYQSENGLEASGIVDDNTFEHLKTSIEDYAIANIPEGMIIDEEQWEAWKPTGKCYIFPFMDAGNEAGYEFTIPFGQGDSNHKTVDFVFIEGENTRTFKNVEMYYGVKDQRMDYVGIWTPDEDIFNSEDFKEACIRLLLSYNIHFDQEKNAPVLNLSRDRAEEIVSYCLDNVEHCLVDNMRIRVIRKAEEPYYSFHMEY